MAQNRKSLPEKTKILDLFSFISIFVNYILQFYKLTLQHLHFFTLI